MHNTLRKNLILADRGRRNLKLDCAETAIPQLHAGKLDSDSDTGEPDAGKLARPVR